MKIKKQHIGSYYRNREIIRLCKNIFSSIDYHGLTPEVRKEVEKDMELWNRKYYEGVSIDRLKEFILQVVDCVFGESGYTSTAKGSDIDGDLPPKEGGS